MKRPFSFTIPIEQQGLIDKQTYLDTRKTGILDWSQETVREWLFFSIFAQARIIILEILKWFPAIFMFTELSQKEGREAESVFNVTQGKYGGA